MEENQYLTIEDNEGKLLRILREGDINDSGFEDNLEMDDFDSDNSDVDSDFVPPVIVDEEDEDAIVSDTVRNIE
ncbi:unnamed protein product [Hermetia illucens]|uniref:Uncharacterized protein n=1 Tax=Hermetia illucens TaxID=343691 RepID=A0A7R8US91_HERIL|nr:unnamed protein product [Hermetia illucens]